MKLQKEAKLFDVNFTHNDFCQKCDEGGALLCCDGTGCPLTYHVNCAGLLAEPEDDEEWFCEYCADKHVKNEVKFELKESDKLT